MSTLGLTESSDQHAVNTTPDTSITLGTCIDCGKLMSRMAFMCPHCGRPYNVPRQQPTTGRIAGGVILGYLGILAINFVVGFVLLMLFAGAIGSALTPPPARSTPSSYR